MARTRPQDLVFTLFGEYLLHREDPVWVGSLIALLQPFGLSEGAVRTVLSRMARKGWLRSRRIGRHSFYDLKDKGRRLLEEGEARIFHPTWDTPWDGTWFLLAYSIPEDRRHLRDRLRDRLAWLGFGSLGNGLWISPHDVEKKVQATAEELDIDQHLECFRARRVGGSGGTELVSRCWDLSALNGRYQAFMERWSPRRPDADTEGGGYSDEDCFRLRFELIHEFRAFPLGDPYLPRSLLHDDWKGDRAAELFREIHDELVGPADRYVDEVLAAGPGVPEKMETA